MTVLVDSNVVIDLATDSPWANWAADHLDALSGEAVALNQLIYAEVSLSYRSAIELDELIGELRLERIGLPWEAAFLAARAHLAYRRSGGKKTSPMPDFYIGAHAQVSGLKLLTRDATRYRTYFPEIELIAPN